MEDVQVKYDGTVRNSLGIVLQFLYGDDALRAEAFENQTLETLVWSDRKMDNVFNFHADDPALFEACSVGMSREVRKSIVDDPVRVRLGHHQLITHSLNQFESAWATISSSVASPPWV